MNKLIVDMKIGDSLSVLASGILNVKIVRCHCGFDIITALKGSGKEVKVHYTDEEVHKATITALEEIFGD